MQFFVICTESGKYTEYLLNAFLSKQHWSTVFVKRKSTKVIFIAPNLFKFFSHKERKKERKKNIVALQRIKWCQVLQNFVQGFQLATLPPGCSSVPMALWQEQITFTGYDEETEREKGTETK